jgi:hypothetical protein
MKKYFVLIACIFIVLSGIANAAPIPFSNVVDFSGGGIDGNVTYAVISEGPNPFQYNHIENFNPSANSFCDVTLSFTHKGNQTHMGELWFLQSNQNVLIGNLSLSTGATGWVTDTFNINSSLYPSFPASSWTFAILLSEGSTLTGGLAIDKSILSGNYNCTSVPEPTTVLLLGFGLIGLAGVRRRLNK